MLQKLRNQSGSWFIKAIFLVIVASFVLWGAGDLIRQSAFTRPIATIGSKKITYEEYAHAWQRAVVNAQQATKGTVTSEQLKSMGLPEKVLESLINQALIHQKIQHFKLLASDETVRDHIRRIPAFHDQTGHFNRRQFDTILHQHHLSENNFIEDTRRNLQQQQLFFGMNIGTQLPELYAQILFKALEEKRVFITVDVPLEKIKISATPSDTELQQLYTTQSTTFQEPERRNVQILLLEPEKIQSKIIISDTQLQEEYKKRIKNYSTSEKRNVQQFIFRSKEMAERAYAQFKKGVSFEKVASEFMGEKATHTEVEHGFFPSDVSNIIFNLPLKNITPVIESSLGWNIYQVTDIKPAYTPSFDKIANQLNLDMKKELLLEQLSNLKIKIEDSLGSGSTLEEIEKHLQVSLDTYKALERNGKSVNGDLTLPKDLKEEVLAQAFDMPEGMDSTLLEDKEGNAAIVRIEKIEPAHLPDFVAIREKVLQAWRLEKQYEAASQLAHKLAENAHSAIELKRLAEAEKLSIKTLNPLSRTDVETGNEELSENLTAQVFALKAGNTAIAPTKNGFKMAMLDKVIPFTFDSEAYKKFKEALQKMAQRDVEELFLHFARYETTVSINQNILQEIINR